MDLPMPTRALNLIPRPLYAPLRKIRTAALWMAEPLDVLHRRITGRSHLPPLWLRRHVGSVAAFERSPGEVSVALSFLDLVRESDTVLDIGCGCGLMAYEFQRILGPEGRYVGFDVHAPAVRWARRHFAADPRLHFAIAELKTPYSEEFRGPVTQYLFPLGDAEADFVLAKSVFTHLHEPEARHYLREVRRVLKPGRRALITILFLDPPDTNGKTPLPALYQFPFGGPHFRWMIEAKPTGVVGVDREFFLNMVADAGLRVGATYDGSWRGLRLAPNPQDLLIVERA
jgi:SAM-dependent methyltransferase